jgi:hypothetical protein
LTIITKLETPKRIEQRALEPYVDQMAKLVVDLHGAMND